ncbi:hypothetical protein KCP76_18345 [Salmonella enterica subsp. enterica serovar Weltevreden]|nr:hypothetical protein KCP76_18345 [Salmonella enterica subsp. enterica serovar Weltevreden]
MRYAALFCILNGKWRPFSQFVVLLFSSQNIFFPAVYFTRTPLSSGSPEIFYVLPLRTQ